MTTVLLERTAFREMFLTGQPPRAHDSPEKLSPAATNLRTIGTELRQIGLLNFKLSSSALPMAIKIVHS